jgi:hypothetical protein
MPILSRIIVICMAVFGCAWIIADSKISLPLRKWIASWSGEQSIILMLIECPPCLSFWLGLATGIGLGLGFYAFPLALVTTCFSVVIWALIGGEST